eukprot:GHVP01009111.1.p1 GENE.GHVP01009111.1~~GHVP01009111.1.p1  ORF type:complete len:100 (-),score=9.88 GHVP01009111.1:134-394(-)
MKVSKKLLMLKKLLIFPKTSKFSLTKKSIDMTNKMHFIKIIIPSLPPNIFRRSGRISSISNFGEVVSTGRIDSHNKLFSEHLVVHW